MGLGVFVKEIERRLETGEIDMAVHSLKDMPTVLPDGMAIGAVLERADPRDALVSHLWHVAERLPSRRTDRDQQSEAAGANRGTSARPEHRPHSRQRGHAAKESVR